MRKHTRFLIMNIVLVSLLFCNIANAERIFASAPEEGAVLADHERTDVETTTEPVIPTESPIETTTEPVIPVEPPIETTTEPVIPVEPPIETTTEPVIPVNPPVETTTEPVIPVVPPIETTTEPVIPESNDQVPGTSEDSASPGREPGASENSTTPSKPGTSENRTESENGTVSDDKTKTDEEIHKGSTEVKKRMPEVISLTMPVFQTDNFVFDYIMDPFGYISETGAVKYGEKTFEEGGTLFFKNMPENGGDQESYSSTSDFLKVVNKSTVSVDLTISLNIIKNEEIRITEDPQFTDDETASMYMALTDREGNTVSADSEGKASWTVRLEPAPENAYIYEYNEETGEYEVVGSNETEFDEIEFAVKGACNTNGSWDSIRDVPEISVVWTAEPQTTDEESASENEAGEDSVSDNSVSENSGESDDSASENGAPDTESPESGSSQPEDGTSENEVPGGTENDQDEQDGNGSGDESEQEFDVVSETTEDTPKAEDVKTMMLDVNQLDVIVREVYEVERSRQKVEPEE